MMHSINELKRINNRKLYTADYIKANNVAKEALSNVGYLVSDTINIITANGVIKGYMYGEYTWFDTKEERDAYRAERNAERAEETKRNKMLKAILAHYKTLSTEELEKIVATL